VSERRATRLSVDQVRAIDHFAENMIVMFPHMMGLAIVGSALTRDDWRDVDLRVVLAPSHYQALSENLTIDDLNALLSRWGQQVTGLPIDCQLQNYPDHERLAFDDDGRPRHHWRGAGMLGDNARRFRAPVDEP
jgi:hypothetical protein